MKSNKQLKRLAFSLMELSVTVAILATVSAATMALVRTSYTAWSRHDDDQAQRREASALQRHITRHIRQSLAVMDISDSSETSGNLSLLMSTGDTYVWEHDTASNEVRFGIGSASSLLATGIEELSFRGFNADGTTETTEVGLIHAIELTSKYNLDRPSGLEANTNSCQAWLRSW